MMSICPRKYWLEAQGMSLFIKDEKSAAFSFVTSPLNENAEKAFLLISAFWDMSKCLDAFESKRKSIICAALRARYKASICILFDDPSTNPFISSPETLGVTMDTAEYIRPQKSARIKLRRLLPRYFHKVFMIYRPFYIDNCYEWK